MVRVRTSPEDQVKAVAAVRQLLDSDGWRHAKRFIDNWVNGATQGLLMAKQDREQELWQRGGVDALTALVGYLESQAMARATGNPPGASDETVTQSHFRERF